MTIPELKSAFNSSSPVRCTYHGKKTNYDRISALIWRKTDSGNVVEAELTDGKSRSVSIALPEQIELRR